MKKIDGELGQLRRLHADAADAEPAPRAVDAAAEQHARPAPRRHDAERRPDDQPAGGSCGSRSASRSARAPGRAAPTSPCLIRNRYGSPVSLQGHDGRGAVHHHDAGAHEQQRGDEQHLVRFELSRHTSPPKGPTGRPTTPDGALNRACEVPDHYEPSATRLVRDSHVARCHDPRRLERSREQSAVISRPGAKTPASQTGAACVPSSQFFTAPTD